MGLSCPVDTGWSHATYSEHKTCNMVSMALWVSSWLSNTKQSEWDLHEAKTLHHSRKLCSTCRSKMIEQSYAAHSLIEICKTMITMRSASIRNMRSDWFAVCHAAGPCLQCIPHVLNSLVWDVHLIPSCSPSLCHFATLPLCPFCPAKRGVGIDFLHLTRDRNIPWLGSHDSNSNTYELII